MKKVLFIIMFFISINYINALEYSCSISGDNIIHSYNENMDEKSLYSFINIEIDNIEELESFRFYAKYDKDLYDVKDCHFLNYNTSGCQKAASDNSLVVYEYNYSKSYELSSYPFYYINFVGNINTPTEGETTIKVYFENVKDKNGKSVEIEPCEKILKFDKTSMTETATETVEITEVNVLIEGYKFKFDENILEYDLKLDNDVNKLKIDVQVPSNYKYTLNGASDLNSSGNKVIITIIDPEENEKVYTIKIIKDKEEIINKDKDNKFINFIYSDKLKKYAPIVIGIIIVILVVILIIRKYNSNKLDKYFDNL